MSTDERPPPGPDDACVVNGCGWYGTAYGSPSPRCSGYGGPNFPSCAIDWLSADPEDREPYADYVADHSSVIWRSRIPPV